MDAQKAVEEAIRLVNKRIVSQANLMGLIAIDLEGNVGAAHNSPNMCWAYMHADMSNPKASITAKLVK
jgi:isoaspartyl peptidase/L-asparaginase-like protein (Ntn-hydrolase superfamily)